MRKGFTIVEVLIGLVLAVVIMGGVVSLMCTGARLFQNASERLDPRESVHVALSQVGLQLMDAWAFEVADTADRIRYRTAQGDGELAYDATTARLVLKAGGVTRILAGGIKRFALREVFAGVLRMELELKRGEATTRVVHEVRVPVLGDRNPLLPVRTVFAPAEA